MPETTLKHRTENDRDGLVVGLKIEINEGKSRKRKCHCRLQRKKRDHCASGGSTHWMEPCGPLNVMVMGTSL